MLKEKLENLRKKGALIHNITNYVTVNDVANVLLAVGASPIMADEIEEIEEITSICDGLNINIGTLNKNTIKSMFLAGKKANALNHFTILDPVGAGASKLRTETAINLLKDVKFNVIKGNISEIKTLIYGNGNTKGVDADIDDIIDEKNIENTIVLIKKFAEKMNSIVVVTGKIDLVSDGKNCYLINNGHPEMSKITGTGCQLSALIVAFLVANPEKILEASVAAVCTMGLAGEIAWKNMQQMDGNSTYRNRLIDAIFNMTGTQLEEGAKYELR